MHVCVCASVSPRVQACLAHLYACGVGIKDGKCVRRRVGLSVCAHVHVCAYLCTCTCLFRTMAMIVIPLCPPIPPMSQVKQLRHVPTVSTPPYLLWFEIASYVAMLCLTCILSTSSYCSSHQDPAMPVIAIDISCEASYSMPIGIPVPGYAG